MQEQEEKQINTSPFMYERVEPFPVSLQMECGDCLELLKTVKDKSIDFLFTDLPYGTTRNAWDVLIPMEPLWKQFRRVIKDNGCIGLWAQPPFSFQLAQAATVPFRYEWIVEKTSATGFLNAKKMPMKAHESVLVFYKKLPTYNPQITEGHSPVHNYTKHTANCTSYGKMKTGLTGGGKTTRYPRDIVKFKWEKQTSRLAPTQKPVTACEYFIKTYTDPGDVVLDTCFGSASTAIACINTQRKFIGMELSDKYFQIGIERVQDHIAALEKKKAAKQ